MSDVTVAREAFLQALQEAEAAVTQANYVATKCEQALERAKMLATLTEGNLATLRAAWEAKS